MKPFIPATAALAILLPAAFADEVTLSNGNTLEGILVTDPAPPQGRIVLEVGSGTIVLDEKNILSVSRSRSKLHDYRDRRASISDSTDPEDYAQLASWARENKCFRYVRELCEKAIELDPNHEGAHRLLGHEKVGGAWLTRGEAMQAKGFILHEGRWLTPAEKELLEAERLRKRELAEARAAERKRKRAEEEQRRREEEERRIRERESQPEGTPYRPVRRILYETYRPYIYSPYGFYGCPAPYGRIWIPSSILSRRMGRTYIPTPVIRWGFPLR